MANKNPNLTAAQEQALHAAWDELITGIAEDLELNLAQAYAAVRIIQAKAKILDHTSLVLDPDDE